MISKDLSISLFLQLARAQIWSLWEKKVRDSCLVLHSAGLCPSSINLRPVKKADQHIRASSAGSLGLDLELVRG